MPTSLVSVDPDVVRKTHEAYQHLILSHKSIVDQQLPTVLICVRSTSKKRLSTSDPE